jgi:hypothetical protein
LNGINNTVEKNPPQIFGEINMTRCNYLDAWFDVQSKKVDETEKKTKKEFITGNKIKKVK